MLALHNIEQAYLGSAYRLNQAVKKLKNLEELKCIGSVLFQRLILSNICTSRTGLVCARLTRLAIIVDTENRIQDSFRRNLLVMLLFARSLPSLQLWTNLNLENDQDFTDILSPHNYNNLPKLDELWIVTGKLRVFSYYELCLWGEACGWRNMRTLMFGRPRDLLAFIAKVPRLEGLVFMPRGENDVDKAESYLRNSEHDAPLVQTLNTIRMAPDYLVRHSPTRLSRAVPWCLLQYARNITTLVIYRPRLGLGWTSNDICAATANDIVQLRNFCPALEELWVDVVVLDFWRSATTKKLLASFAQIEKLKRLRIYLHVDKLWHNKVLLGRLECCDMFRIILDKRKNKQLSCEAPFAVDFKVVRNWDKMRDNYWIADYEFWIDESGQVRFKKRPRVKVVSSWAVYKADIRKDYHRPRESTHVGFLRAPTLWA
jgi:hypothetical protein